MNGQRGMIQGLFAGYKLLEIIGTGGSAMVYRAVEIETDRHVALKILHSRIEEGTVESRRFEREAQIAQRLKHPGIIEIYGYGRYNGLAYFSMELMAGGSLGFRFRKPATVALDETLKILEAIAAPLDYAHAQGVLHRDLKLDNVMVGENGELKLGDFGLSRIIESSRITTSGMTFGTPIYMSPEQIRNLRNVDSRSDIYSFAVIAYLLTTGYYPFFGGSDLTIMKQQISWNPPLPSNLNPKLPRHMNAVLLKGLAKKPDDRYSSAQELVDAFRESISRLTDVEIVVLTSQPTPVIPRREQASLSSRGRQEEHPDNTVIFDDWDNLEAADESAPARSRRVSALSVVGALVLVVIVGMMMLRYIQAMVPQVVPTPTEIGLEVLETASPTPSPTFTLTVSPTPSPSRTPSATTTSSREPSRTRTPTRTVSPTRASSTARPTRTPSRTTSPTRTGTGSGSGTATRQPSATRTTLITATSAMVIAPTSTSGSGIATTVRPATLVQTTAVAPTSIPPTQVQPTSVPPTQVPPTAVPPTSVPPTVVPPTLRPPTAVPPTPVPPTPVPPTPVPPTNTPVIQLPLPTIPLVQTLLPGLLG